MDRLFAEGSSFLVFPLKVVWLPVPQNEIYPAQAAFAVSKRTFKKAVLRNLLKRRMREAYRLNKNEWYRNIPTGQVAVFFIFIGREMADYQSVQAAIKKAMLKISKELTT